MLADVTAAVTMAADLIKNARAIINAVNDGAKYLNRYYPDVKPDLVDVLKEMRKTLDGLAQVTSVITSFQFTVAGPARNSEPSRFNDYVINKTADLERLREQRSALKGSCDKIQEHRDVMSARSGEMWSGWALLLGEKRRERREELAGCLGTVFADDQHIIMTLDAMMDVVANGLRDVTAALGKPTAANPRNVAEAAKVLGEYATELAPLKKECQELADRLGDEIRGLT